MKNIIALSLIVFFSAVCYGQKKGSEIGYFNWNFGPIVNNNFVSNFSGRGANVGYSYFIKKNLAIGGEVGWNNYYEYAPRQTYVEKGGATTTDMYKYVFTLPVTATVTKYFNTGNIFLPYAKLGLGTLYSEQNQYYNIYENDNSNWGFLAVPELGVNIKTSQFSPFAFNLGAQYKIATNKASQYNMNNIQTFNFNVGGTFQFR